MIEVRRGDGMSYICERSKKDGIRQERARIVGILKTKGVFVVFPKISKEISDKK